jgi:hypothetical protein
MESYPVSNDNTEPGTGSRNARDKRNKSQRALNQINNDVVVIQQ